MNLTAAEYAPLMASLVSQDPHTEQNDLEKFKPAPLDEAVATVIPVLASNETQTAAVAIGSVNIQTMSTLQRNANVSRDQLNSRTVIKSSSPSAISNNSTIAQKQHKPDAPMLNYIFDSHLANKHRHYDPRYVWMQTCYVCITIWLSKTFSIITVI